MPKHILLVISGTRHACECADDDSDYAFEDEDAMLHDEDSLYDLEDEDALALLEQRARHMQTHV